MDTKINDWFTVRFLNSDRPIEFLISEGITAENSTLQDKDFYKNKTKVQEVFKKNDGSFDNDAFDKFYNDIKEEYKYLSAINTENYILNAYEKSASNFSTNFGTQANLLLEVEKIANPLDQSFGLVSTNEWSIPIKSKREAAQNNQYWDNELQKWSDKTVNDAGLFGLLTGKSLVYATWDEDGTHIDPFTKQEVKHIKGEWKTDQFGNFYAETTSNEENLGKQFVTWSEVLTDDNSPWNKIDIFDSDSIDSSITKTLLRGTALVGASLISAYVAPTLFYTTSAINFVRHLPQVSKSLAAFFGAKEFDTLNTWDNTMRRFAMSKSDYASDHWWSLESLLDMAVDSYLQLGQQRAIAMIPQKLGIGKTAVQKAQTAEFLQRLKFAKEGKVSNEVIEALTKSTKAYREANKVFNDMSKISTAVSHAYLVTTSVDDVYNQAKQYGFDSQTAGVISLATYAALGTLFRTDYFRGMLYNTPDYEVSRDIKLLTKKWFQNAATTMQKDLGQLTTDAAKLPTLKKWGNNLITFLKNHVDDVKSGHFGIASGALNEALEELSEEVAQDLSFQVGKSWQLVKEIITGKEYTNDYNYLNTDPLSRYAMSFVGGGIGGAIFKLADRMHFQKNAYKQWKDLMGGDNTGIMKELVYHISQGRKDLILNQVAKLEKNNILSTTLDAITGEPTKNSEDSMNSVIFNMFKKAVDDIDSFLTNYNLKADYERFGDIELLRGVRVAWLTSVANEGKGLQNSLFEDYQNRITEIINEQADIQNLKNKISDKTPNQEVEEINKEVTKHQAILDWKIAQIRQLLKGNDDSYIGRLFLQSNQDILDKIVPTTLDGMSEYLYGQKYDQLPITYQKEIDEYKKNNNLSGLIERNYISAWNLYKNIASDNIIKTSFDEIQNYINGKINNNLPVQPLINPNDLTPEEQKEKILFSRIAEDLLLKKINIDATTSSTSSLTSEQIINLYHTVKGHNIGIFNAQDSGNIIFRNEFQNNNNINWQNIENKIDEIWTNIQNSKDSATKKFNEDPSVLQKWLQQSDNTLNYNEALYLLTGDIDINAIKHLFNNIYDNIQDKENTSKTYILTNINLQLQTKIDNLIQEIFSKLKLDDDYKNFYNKIINLQKESKEIKDKFTLSYDQINYFDNLEKQFTLIEALADGSNINRTNTIMDIPFGANNYLNEAFKDKNIELKLSQIDSTSNYYINSYLNDIRRRINNLKELNRQNIANVINNEKKIGISYNKHKVQLINQLLQTPEFINLIGDNFKSKIGDSPEVKLLNELKSDEDFITNNVAYKKYILAFENEIANRWKNWNDDQKNQYINTIIQYFENKDLWKDTDILESKCIEDNFQYQNSTSFMWLMSCIFENTNDIVSELYNIFQSENYFPFDSQFEVITSICKFLCSENVTSDQINSFLSKTFTEEDAKDNIYSVSTICKVICAAGTGKSKVIIPSIIKVIRSLQPNKKIYVTSNTQIQVNELTNSLMNIIHNDNIFVTNELIKTLANEEEFKNKYENSIIIIDECTNISSDNLKKLDELAKKYNIKIAAVGDTRQHSNESSIDNAVAFATVQLFESKRSLTNIARKNNLIIEKWLTQNNDGAISFNFNNTDTFYYYDDGSSIIEGIKFDNNFQISNITVDYINEFINKYQLDPNTSILIFTSNQLNLEDIAKIPAKITIANQYDEIQGNEWDYVLTDVKIEISNQTEIKDRDNILKDTYTLFTRQKHALISLGSLNFQYEGKKLDIHYDTNNKSITDKPIYNGLINNIEGLNKLKSYQQNVFEKLNIKRSKKIKPHSEVPTTLPLAELPIQTISSGKSLAQVASGFILKKEMNIEYIKEFLKKVDSSKYNDSYGNDYYYDEYMKIKNTIFMMVTSPKNSESDYYKKLLPAKLQNGKVLISIERHNQTDLNALGNFHRDEKYLTGNNLYPWLVYYVPELDLIHLGMFHNPQTSDNNSSISQTADAINKLTIDGEGKLFELPDNLIIDRSTNIVDIQNNENPNSYNVGFEVKHGKWIGKNQSTKNNEYNNYLGSLWAASNIMYFKYSTTDDFNTAYIFDLLDKLKQKYKKFYDLAFKGSNPIYNNDTATDVKELISYIRQNDGVNIWKARGVPDLRNKFVSFITLATIENKSLKNQKELLKQYWSFLSYKIQLLEEINNILIDQTKSAEQKRLEIKEKLNTKRYLTITPIAVDVQTVDAKDKDKFINILKDIKNENFKSFNNAIIHQIGISLYEVFTVLSYDSNNSVFKNKNKDFNFEDEYIWLKSIIDDFGETRLLNALNSINRSIKSFNDISKFLYDLNIKEDNEKRNFIIHCCQHEEIQNFLQQLYSADNWSKIVYKLNKFKYNDRIEKSESQTLNFTQHLFPQLLANNGLLDITKTNNASFTIKSKVIQPAHIFIWGENTNTNNFKEFNKDQLQGQSLNEKNPQKSAINDTNEKWIEKIEILKDTIDNLDFNEDIKNKLYDFVEQMENIDNISQGIDCLSLMNDIINSLKIDQYVSIPLKEIKDNKIYNHIIEEIRNTNIIPKSKPIC